MATLTGNSSPRIAEYGRSADRKNGWKTFNWFSAMPRPLFLDKATALSIQVVIESGTVTFIDALPLASVKIVSHIQVSGKYWRTLCTSAKLSADATVVAED